MGRVSYDAPMMRTALVLAPLLLVTACASHDPPPAGPAQPPAQPGAAPDPLAAVIADGKAPWLWRGDEGDPASPSYLQGVVGQRGISHCPEGTYDRQWLALRPTIGRVGVSGPEDSVLDPVMDTPVLAIGKPGMTPEQRPLSVTPEMCPPMQMRSDWTETPRGMRITREPRPSISHFELSAVRPLHELQAHPEGDHIVVTLLNPIPVALRDVELHVHYEGCFGKPGSTIETTEIGELAVGALASARVPRHVTKSGARPGRESFRAFSVQLVAEGDRVFVDLDVGLGALGVESECPDR